MTAECTQRELRFEGASRRDVVMRFDGGPITSDGGSPLLLAADRRTGLLARFAGCFRDHRSAERIDHTVLELVRQRVFGIALGYEDLNDHDVLRLDPLLSTIVGKDSNSSTMLAGKSTLNR